MEEARTSWSEGPETGAESRLGGREATGVGARGETGAGGPGEALRALAARQHGAARLAASGASLRDVAALLGIEVARAQAWLDRPAVADLIAHYRSAA